jgi:hypothetical protein
VPRTEDGDLIVSVQQFKNLRRQFVLRCAALILSLEPPIGELIR